MIERQNIECEAHRSLHRILPRVEEILKPEIKKDRQGWTQFSSQLHKYFSTLFALYADVYSDRYDFFFYVEDLIVSIARLWFSRPQDSRELDIARELNPRWFVQSVISSGIKGQAEELQIVGRLAWGSV